MLENINAPDLYSPLQSLYAQYQRDRASVESIAASIDDKMMDYFFQAAMVNNHRGHIGVSEVFKLEPAIKAIDASYWQKAMMMTDVLEYMPADKRNKWHEQIRKHDTPEFNIDTARNTLKEMICSREKFLAERVDGIFRELSRDHVTNIPQGFGKRFIMWLGDCYGYAYERVNYVHDLRCVIAKIMGRDNPNSARTHTDIRDTKTDGQWHYFDGGSIKIRRYKKGTAHFEVHPEISYRLNQILSYLHPNAIPAEFRTKPKKAAKEYKLTDDLLGFDVIVELSDICWNNHLEKWTCRNGKVSGKTESVIEYIGGIKDNSGWLFDYDVTDVIKEICRTGSIPDYKSHQYYPTPKHIAIDAVKAACVADNDSVLEPSAGQGALAEQIISLHPDCNLECVEVSELQCRILEEKGFNNIKNCDFLKLERPKQYKKIIMNPPFSDGRSVAHLKHAFNMLSDGGVLVAILPASFKGKCIIDGSHHEYSKVYHNEFKGCSVNVIIVTITRNKSS